MSTVTTTVALPVDIRRRQGKTLGVPQEHRTLPALLATPFRWLMVNQVRRRRAQKRTLIVNHTLFDGLGGLCRNIKEGAASWQALDIIYNYTGQGSFVDWFWIGHMLNAQAVRNRKRIIVSELHKRCADIIASRGSVKILSLASGSAQAVFEALAGLPPHAVEVLLIDFDRKAGPYALELAKRNGFEGRVTFKAGNLLKFERPIMTGNFVPDIVEMAGLLDYLHDGEAVELIRKIRGVLPDHGMFVTCHIHDNAERAFMTEIIGWGLDDGKQRPMLYRTPQELTDLLRAAGFTIMTVFVEPHRIHSVVVAEKT
jgi:hypothetical protein